MRQPKEGEGRETTMRAEGGEEITRREESKSHGEKKGHMRENEMRFNYGCEKGDGEGSPPHLLFGRKGRIHVRFVSPTPLHTDSGIRHMSVSGEKYDMKFVSFCG